MKTIGYAAKHGFSSLRPMSIDRREPASNDVSIEILFCGVCHSDVHQVKNEWKNTVYPCMPGHEIVGKVTAVGSAVKKFKVGDRVGVGCMVDSCHTCTSCKEGLEQYCESEKGFLATYNGNMRKPEKENLTFGGYSEAIVVREDFVLKIPDALDSAAAAPILCAGVTTWSPMRRFKVGPGTKIGIVGLGGLGQIAVKLARGLGATVTVLTTSDDKVDDAKKLGAANVIVSTDKDAMKQNESTLNLILSTIPTTHDANLYMPLLRREGTYVVIGCLLPLKLPLDMSGMVTDRRSLSSTLIGGIRETQEVLNFCAEHGIASDIKVIPIDEVNEAFKQVDEGAVDYRFVIDMSTIHGKKEDESLLGKAGL